MTSSRPAALVASTHITLLVLGQCRSRRKAEEGCRETGFKPAEAMERPGIEAEMASYTIAG
jgi:hypothetical protein